MVSEASGLAMGGGDVGHDMTLPSAASAVRPPGLSVIRLDAAAGLWATSSGGDAGHAMTLVAGSSMSAAAMPAGSAAELGGAALLPSGLATGMPAAGPSGWLAGLGSCGGVVVASVAADSDASGVATMVPALLTASASG